MHFSVLPHQSVLMLLGTKTGSNVVSKAIVTPSFWRMGLWFLLVPVGGGDGWLYYGVISSPDNCPCRWG